MRYIETTRLVLRDFVPEDAAQLHEMLGDPETMAKLEPAYDFEHAETFLRSFCIQGRGALAAEQRQSGRLIGYILFNEIERGEYEMGWIINRAFWRRGYAFEACSAVMDYAFREIGAHRVFAETVDTERSATLMQKLGMNFEGKQGDMYCYGLTGEAWEGKI